MIWESAGKKVENVQKKWEEVRAECTLDLSIRSSVKVFLSSIFIKPWMMSWRLCSTSVYPNSTPYRSPSHS